MIEAGATAMSNYVDPDYEMMAYSAFRAMLRTALSEPYIADQLRRLLRG